MQAVVDQQDEDLEGPPMPMVDGGLAGVRSPEKIPESPDISGTLREVPLVHLSEPTPDCCRFPEIAPLSEATEPRGEVTAAPGIDCGPGRSEENESELCGIGLAQKERMNDQVQVAQSESSCMGFEEWVGKVNTRLEKIDEILFFEEAKKEVAIFFEKAYEKMGQQEYNGPAGEGLLQEAVKMFTNKLASIGMKLRDDSGLEVEMLELSQGKGKLVEGPNIDNFPKSGYRDYSVSYKNKLLEDQGSSSKSVSLEDGSKKKKTKTWDVNVWARHLNDCWGKDEVLDEIMDETLDEIRIYLKNNHGGWLKEFNKDAATKASSIMKEKIALSPVKEKFGPKSRLGLGLAYKHLSTGFLLCDWAEQVYKNIDSDEAGVMTAGLKQFRYHSLLFLWYIVYLTFAASEFGLFAALANATSGEEERKEVRPGVLKPPGERDFFVPAKSDGMATEAGKGSNGGDMKGDPNSMKMENTRGNNGKVSSLNPSRVGSPATKTRNVDSRREHACGNASMAKAAAETPSRRAPVRDNVPKEPVANAGPKSGGMHWNKVPTGGQTWKKEGGPAVGPQPQPQGGGKGTQNQRKEAAEVMQQTVQNQEKKEPAANLWQEEKKKGPQRELFRGETSGVGKEGAKKPEGENQREDPKTKEGWKEVEGDRKGIRKEVKTKNMNQGVGRGSYYDVLGTDVDGDGDQYDTSKFKTDWDPGDGGESPGGEFNFAAAKKLEKKLLGRSLRPSQLTYNMQQQKQGAISSRLCRRHHGAMRVLSRVQRISCRLNNVLNPFWAGNNNSSSCRAGNQNAVWGCPDDAEG
nr:hypothetical protein Iba_chr02cCG0010 [Ipomoea batatas]